MEDAETVDGVANANDDNDGGAMVVDEPLARLTGGSITTSSPVTGTDI